MRGVEGWKKEGGKHAKKPLRSLIFSRSSDERDARIKKSKKLKKLSKKVLRFLKK